MKLLAVLAVTLAVVTSTTIPSTTTVKVPVNESDTESVIPSASVGEVEVPAVVEEVEGDWLAHDGSSVSVNDDEDDTDDDESDYVDEDNDEYDEEDEEEVHNDYEYVADKNDYDFEEDDYEEVGTQEEFEANVPVAIHGAKDVIIHKDNFISILRTIVLAYTHKEKPSYSEILKAGGVSAFKTSFKYLGKENLGANLLKMAKRLTNTLDEDASDDFNDEILAELAEEYLSSHKFKLVLPESVLLHKKEMEEFLDKREIDEIEGRSFVSNRQFDIAMPRTDPAVQTILTIGPMTWAALIGGLFSIPYLFSSSDSPGPARVDHVIPNPSPFLSAPGLPFFHTHQLRRDEDEQVPHQAIDQEYLEYQQSYAEWYNQWYLRYKNYYDEYYPNHQQPHPSTLQHQQQPHPSTLQHQQQPHPSTLQQQQHHHQQQLQAASSLDIMAPPPPIAQGQAKELPQKPLHPTQKPLPPKQKLPKQPPPIQFGNPIHQQIPTNPIRPPIPGSPLRVPISGRPVHVPISGRPVHVPIIPGHPVRPHFPVVGESPRLDSARHAGANIVSTAEDKPNTFGTFQSEDNKADTHFKVIQGPETIDTTTVRPLPKVPSPQPVYIPTSDASVPKPVYIPTTDTPKTERGFKPITKPDSATASPNTTPSSEDKDEFRAPKDETLVTGQSKAKTSSSSSSADSKTTGGFKPIPPPSDAPVAKKEPETSTIKISAVTSGVFKTSTGTTPAPATTPVTGTTSRPAVFVRTATQKSVRVVTSSSVVFPSVSSGVSSSVALPELKRPQRHHQSTSNLQQISNQVKTQQPLPVHQRLPLQQQQPAVSQVVQQQKPVVQQIPAAVQPQRLTVQPQRPAIQQQVPAVQQQRPAVWQQVPVVQQQRPVVQQQGPTVQQLQPVVQQQIPGVQQQQQQQGPPRPNNLNTGFVKTNIPTIVKVVDHRPPQGFGLGPKPTAEPTTTTTPIPIYALDPFYGSRLSRTDVIFHQLGVVDEGCREQVVCNIYKNPDVYTPYSDYLSRQLTVKLEELQRPKVSDERILRFFRYLKAAREGQDGSDCVAKYPECHMDTSQLSHKPIVKAYQKVSILMDAASS